MIRILKRGNAPQNAVYHLLCWNCHTEFEFTADEAVETAKQLHECDGRPGEVRVTLTLPCPVCAVKLEKDKKAINRYMNQESTGDSHPWRG